MHVLDLDLDFFLDHVAFNRSDDVRLPGTEYTPWNEQEVRTFLENNCRLSPDRRLPGRIIEHHDQAFDYWHELIGGGHLAAPFEVVHIDAHADLGYGDAGYVYLMSEMLHVKPEDRPSLVDRGQVKFGNYLAFAIACRWISRLEYCRHPESGKDLMWYHFKNLDIESGFIQLRKLERGVFDDIGLTPNIRDIPVLELEPEVPFEIHDSKAFQTAVSFDFIVLSKSPGFTPPESDKLIPVIGRYIDTLV